MESAIATTRLRRERRRTTKLLPDNEELQLHVRIAQTAEDVSYTCAKLQLGKFPSWCCMAVIVVIVTGNNEIDVGRNRGAATDQTVSKIQTKVLPGSVEIAIIQE